MERHGHPVLGRDAELTSIDAWLAQVPGAVTARLLVIAGEPGIGKTTLWGEVMRRACRSTHAARTRVATDGVASTRSMRIPRFF